MVSISEMSDEELLAIIDNQDSAPSPPDLSGIDISQLEALASQPEPEQRQAGFVQRLGEAFGERQRNVGQSLRADAANEQLGVETVGQIFGQGLGAVGDVLGNVAISGFNALPDVPFGLGEIGSLALDAGRGIASSPPVQNLGNLATAASLSATGRTPSQVAEDNPRALRNIEAATNIAAAFAPTVRGANVGSAAQLAGKGVESAAKRVAKLIPEPTQITSQDLRREASKFYTQARGTGAEIKPELTQKISDDILNKIKIERESLAPDVREAFDSVSDPEGSLQKLLSGVERQGGKPLSLEGFQNIDKTLGNLAYSASTPNDVSEKIIQIQKGLREAVESASPGDLVSPESFEVYKKARDLWSKQARIGELEDIVARAFSTKQPASSIRSGLGRFAANKDNLKGFSDVEIRAIKSASKTGILGDLTRTISSRLPSTVALAADPALSPALTLASRAARDAGDVAATRDVQSINNLIATGDAAREPLSSSISRSALGGIESLGRGTQGAFGQTQIPIPFAGGAQAPVSLGNLSTLGTFESIQREQQRQQQINR